MPVEVSKRSMTEHVSELQYYKGLKVSYIIQKQHHLGIDRQITRGYTSLQISDRTWMSTATIQIESQTFIVIAQYENLT